MHLVVFAVRRHRGACRRLLVVQLGYLAGDGNVACLSTENVADIVRCCGRCVVVRRRHLEVGAPLSFSRIVAVGLVACEVVAPRSGVHGRAPVHSGTLAGRVHVLAWMAAALHVGRVVLHLCRRVLEHGRTNS